MTYPRTRPQGRIFASQYHSVIFLPSNVPHTMKLATLLSTAVLALILGGSLTAAATMDELAAEVEAQVRQATIAANSTERPTSVMAFEDLAGTASWTEIWPGVEGREVSRSVEGRIWNAAIQSALGKNGAVFLPKRDEPYYINEPIVLRSGQRIVADREAELRLVPGVNTCMVRNEHIVGGQGGPMPADLKPDAGIVIEGGIWTTLATSPTQCNGNEFGRSARQGDVPGCHGVILLNSVRGVVVRNVTIRQAKAHGIQLSNCREFLVEGVLFDQHRRDGVHVNGPAAYGVIRNIRGSTGDDFIALNAWDWRNAAPTFGPIDHVLIEGIHCSGGTDEIRLLPGVKNFVDGTRLACPVSNSVFRDLHDVRTVKIYDQPNLELGRDQDFSDPVGTVRNVHFSRLTMNRDARFQIAADVDGLSIDGVQLAFDLGVAENSGFKLVEIGPMSQTIQFDPGNPSTWVELFSPDRDVTVRGFHLTNVSMRVGDRLEAVSDPETRLVRVADQTPNPDYPKTTPRGGTGRAIVVP